MSKLRKWRKFLQSGQLSVKLLALWKLFKHPDTPRVAKWVAVAVVVYALSPIDLIPDVIPVLGQLDDLILVPLGIALAVRLTPQPLWEARLQEAERSRDQLPRLLWGALLVVVVWVLLMVGLVWWLLN